MLKAFLIFLALLSSCSHIVPKAAQSIPLIKMSNKGQILTIPIESYVASVLAGEVSPSWPMEALKAQAIASRTFALKRMKDRKNKPFHVENSHIDQVFRHEPAAVFVEAVKETAGLVLAFNSEPIEASFHSTCGGHTANAKEVWGQSYSYLKGVPCTYCSISPSYKWSSKFKISELEKKLGQKISNIKILNKNSDERVKSLQLAKNNISGHQFRTKIGPVKIRSTLITAIEKKAQNITIHGQGFGHGVGLCQYGALGMAKNGFLALGILAYYYPGTEIKKFY
jgi:stage II sporulation protein D